VGLIVTNPYGQAAGGAATLYGRFVTPGGGTGAGTLADPWSLSYALSGAYAAGKLLAGDTVWLRGHQGKYPNVSNLGVVAVGVQGTSWDREDGKIIYRAYNPDVARIQRREWLDANGDATWYGTGDPRKTELVLFESDRPGAAPTAGAVTVSGAQTGTSLTVAKAAGVNQPIVAGEVITIASGSAAGDYVIQNATTIVQNTTTVLTISPALRGAGTSGNEACSLTLHPSDNNDMITVQTGSNGLWFWDLRLKQIHYLRSVDFTGAGFSTFNQTTNGLKVINTSFQDFPSTPIFVDRPSGRVELNGNLMRYTGTTPPGTTDGGGHGNYVHHEIGGDELLAEAQCFLNAYCIDWQLYDTANPATQGKCRVKNNISLNTGQVSLDANLGGANATTMTFSGSQGGATVMQDVIAEGNVSLLPLLGGDRAWDWDISGTRIGSGNQNINNYARGSGGGFGMLYMGKLVAATGGFTHTGNEYVCYQGQSGPPQINGLVIQLQENGAAANAGYVWGGNTYWRVPTSDNPACGDEAGAPKAFRRPGAACANRTLSSFSTTCSFPTGGQSADTLNTVAPTVTKTFVRKRRWAKGSAFVAYDNWGSLTQIPINLSSFLNVGDYFYAHDVRDIDGTPVLPVQQYAGGTVNFPNTQVADPPISGAHPGLALEVAAIPATAPNYNAFLVRRVA